MRRDVELDALAEQVRAIFGGNEIVDAYIRAIFVAASTARSEQQYDELVESWGEAPASGVKIVDGGAVQSAFRQELHRLLTRH
jgi:hypothetical protein